MKVYKQGVNMTILLRNMVKWGDVSIRLYSALLKTEHKLVRSIALANTRENRNSRAVLYTKMPWSAG